MPTPRELLTAAMNGGTPERTPLSFYNWMAYRESPRLLRLLNEGLPAEKPRTFYQRLLEDPSKADWARLLDQGLGVCMHCNPYRWIEHGVEDVMEEKVEDDHHYRILKKITPVGTIQRVTLNGWHYEDWIKTPQDYQTRQWIAENMELVPAYEQYARADEFIGDYGIPVVTGSRAPAMSINIDWVGTEQFCLDIGLEVPELFDLYEAQKKRFMEEVRLIAAGPGRFVKWFENLTIRMIGSKRYRDLLVSVYNEAIPLLAAAGKRVMVHYDGELRVIADQIAATPMHIIESLTEPPEGDMMYDECRAAWPDKAFWGNINLEHYYLPPDKLAEEVVAKRERAGKRGFAFEISEDVPKNFAESFPVVLRTLEELG
jgi:hypothetical protein